MQTALMLFLNCTTKEIPAQAQTQKKKAKRIFGDAVCLRETRTS